MNLRKVDLISKEKPFHDPRKKVELFKDSIVNSNIKKDKETIIEVNRNILGKLLSIPASSEHNIDFQKVLEYPLSPIPLSLAHPDGSKRTCPKSKRTEMITKHSLVHQPSIYAGGNVGKYITDLMATLRTFKTIPGTYELLTWKLIEADTKIALHCNHTLQNVSGLVGVPYPSGDVDRMIILLQFISSPGRVFLDYGEGKNRKSIKLNVTRY